MSFLDNHRINESILNILEENVPQFEESLDPTISTQAYWGTFFRMFGEQIYEHIKIYEASYRCSEIVLNILHTFDTYKLSHPTLTFPSNTLGRCRITARAAEQEVGIPYYNLSKCTLIEYSYHEVIIIVNDELITDDAPLLAGVMVYDICMNKQRTLQMGGFIRSLIPTEMIHMFAPRAVIPDYITLNMSHRHGGLVDFPGNWKNYQRTLCLDNSWFS